MKHYTKRRNRVVIGSSSARDEMVEFSMVPHTCRGSIFQSQLGTIGHGREHVTISKASKRPFARWLADSSSPVLPSEAFLLRQRTDFDPIESISEQHAEGLPASLAEKFSSFLATVRSEECSPAPLRAKDLPLGPAMRACHDDSI